MVIKRIFCLEDKLQETFTSGEILRSKLKFVRNNVKYVYQGNWEPLECLNGDIGQKLTRDDMLVQIE